MICGRSWGESDGGRRVVVVVVVVVVECVCGGGGGEGVCTELAEAAASKTFTYSKNVRSFVRFTK